VERLDVQGLKQKRKTADSKGFAHNSADGRC
jgi:hypothetical protein